MSDGMEAYNMRTTSLQHPAHTMVDAPEQQWATRAENAALVYTDGQGR